MAGADYIYCSKCNKKALYYEGDPPDGLTIICASCSALAAAEPPDAPGDAEFEAAVSDLQAATYRHARIQEGEFKQHYADKVPAARARVLDLHRQARLAGIREGRKWPLWALHELRDAVFTLRIKSHNDEVIDAYTSALDKIDAMLKEADTHDQ